MDTRNQKQLSCSIEEPKVDAKLDLIESKDNTAKEGPVKINLDDALKAINHETRSSIHLSGYEIDNAGARSLASALEKNDTVTSIDLSDTMINCERVEALAASLEKNTVLTLINLSRNSIQDAGIQSLAKALEKNVTLTSIDLSHNNIGEIFCSGVGIQSLAMALEKNTSLKSIDLSWNNIGNSGARLLAALEKNPVLSCINLDGNKIGEVGAQSLATAMRKNTTLTSINLHGNNIGDSGAKSLGALLESNKTITSIDLGRNSITLAGAQLLATALAVNTTLTSIDLSSNCIQCSLIEAGDQFIASLEKNTKLTSIDISNNGCNENIVLAIENLMIRNQKMNIEACCDQSKINQKNVVGLLCPILEKKEVVVKVFEHHGIKFNESTIEPHAMLVATISDSIIYLLSPARDGLSLASSLSSFLTKYNPDYIIMTGICAGHPDEVKRGDVIIGNCVLNATLDKMKGYEVLYDSTALGIGKNMLASLSLVKDKSDCWLASEYTCIPRPCALGKKQNRAIWHLYQVDNFILNLKGLQDRMSLVLENQVRGIMVTDWQRLLGNLLSLGLIIKKDQFYYLSENGVSYAKKQFEFGFKESAVDDGIVEPTAKAFIGAIGVFGESNVSLTLENWRELTNSLGSRDLLGIEMQGIALFKVVSDYNENSQPKKRAIVLFAKGVMDYANIDKDDTYKLYAAHASAACALYFITNFVAKI